MKRFVLNLADERTRWTITPTALAQLKAALPRNWELVNLSAPTSSVGDGRGVSEEALNAVETAEVYVGFGFPRELLLAAGKGGRLRWVHTGSAGVGSLLYPEMLTSDVVLTNSAGIHAHPMAETVIALALHFARGLDFAVRSQAQGVWDQSAFESTSSPITELQDLTMGILGYGGVGREVARRASALGMRVLATRRTAATSDAHAEILVSDPAGVQRVLREADVVVIAMPATGETRGLIGARELALMKPGAVLINVARGDIVVERDLIAVLERGAIRGAGLDVFEHEPLPAESPLWQLPNVLVLPHVSGTTARFWEREAELIVDNIGRYLAGLPLRNTVDKARGY
jgi:phosphoglycerate dehydrogenase-like enzyme